MRTTSTDVERVVLPVERGIASRSEQACRASQTAVKPIAITPEITHLLASHAPVAIGVSGGRDSDAAAFATLEYLDYIGHQGPRLLIHSDLGRTEWAESLPQCERLAERLGTELVVVRRQAGDMLDRWLTRWSNNVERYCNLECVKLILPWSTAGMRFCTSELKTAIICRELVKRFPGRTIVSVAGIRREESPKRKRAPIAKQQPKLRSATQQTSGYDWLPIVDWTSQDVLALHEARDFPLHPAYRTNSRVSCRYCVLGSEADLRASTAWEESHDLYREMVELEIVSTFSFQARLWLGDLAPHLLSAVQRAGLAEAKRRAKLREAIADAMNAAIGRGFLRVGKKAAGRLLDGRTWDEFPDTAYNAPVASQDGSGQAGRS